MMKLEPAERARLGHNGRQLVSGKYGIDRILKEYDRAVSSLETGHI